MAIVTLATLRTRARERSDETSTTFITDSELNSYLNASAQKLYDLLVEANQDYYVTGPTSFTIAGGASSYDLGATFYKLRGVDVSLNGSWVPVHEYDQMERGRYQDLAPSQIYSSVYYHLFNGTLEFLPADSAPGSYRVRFVPFMTVMTVDADTFNGYNGFEEFIVVDTAIKMKDKSESDTKVLERERADQLMRIEAMANTRNYAAASHVADVRSYSRAVY